MSDHEGLVRIPDEDRIKALEWMLSRALGDIEQLSAVLAAHHDEGVKCDRCNGVDGPLPQGRTERLTGGDA